MILNLTVFPVCKSGLADPPLQYLCPDTGECLRPAVWGLASGAQLLSHLAGDAVFGGPWGLFFFSIVQSWHLHLHLLSPFSVPTLGAFIQYALYLLSVDAFNFQCLCSQPTDSFALLIPVAHEIPGLSILPRPSRRESDTCPISFFQQHY